MTDQNNIFYVRKFREILQKNNQRKDKRRVFMSFFCNDASIFAAIVKINTSGRINVMGLSTVLGMGMGQFERCIVDIDFDEVQGYNSFSGVSFIAIRRYDLWGLLRIRWVEERAKTYSQNPFVLRHLHEPIHHESVDSLSREIIMLEKPSFPVLEPLLEQYSVTEIDMIRHVSFFARKQGVLAKESFARRANEEVTQNVIDRDSVSKSVFFYATPLTAPIKLSVEDIASRILVDLHGQHMVSEDGQVWKQWEEMEEIASKVGFLSNPFGGSGGPTNPFV